MVTMTQSFDEEAFLTTLLGFTANLGLQTQQTKEYSKLTSIGRVDKARLKSDCIGESVVNCIT